MRQHPRIPRLQPAGVRHYRWRAISEGEMFGAWAAELEISALGSNGAYFERCRHYKKMMWYARKAALKSA